jgi:hypothetical protein
MDPVRSVRPPISAVSSTRSSAILAALLAVALACDGARGPSTPADLAVFRLRVCVGSAHAPNGEQFRVQVLGSELVAEMQSLVGQGDLFVMGALLRGDGGFNARWSWHLAPESVEVVSGAIEACEGCPSFVEAELESWLGRDPPQYCPTGVTVLGRER